jgi:class 3 adenylate cyclase/tetratricopeptide (TPR) repeat protein
MQSCPACGEPNADHARFCQACGRPLAVASDAEETRRLVSIVFTDVVGSTALGETLDPETVREVMLRYFDRMREPIERYGGRIEKYIGDAVMAIFGVPSAHEDDAKRAVRAAVGMRESLAELNAELRVEFGVEIGIRTGVNSGHILATDAARNDAFPLGDAANVAARFEQAAGPGEIVIGEPTFRLVRDAVRAERLEPLVLKGKADPVVAHRLIELVDLGPGRRLDSPMVGRDGELAGLLKSFADAEQARACRVVTVVGEAGVGKSRLLWELEHRVAGRAALLRGRCLSYGSGMTYWPLAEVIRGAAGIRDTDAPETARRRLELFLGGDPEATRVADGVAQLLGIARIETSPEDLRWSMRRFLELSKRGRPLVVILEDVHWAEPSLLDLLEVLASTIDTAVLLVCSSRPDLRERYPGWFDRFPSVAVGPLDDGQAKELVANLLGSVSLDADVHERVLEAAGGNPLFVEEFLSMLIDDGLLRRDADRWVAAGDLSGVAVPPGISQLLGARFDRVSTREREVLQGAAVAGKVFSEPGVTELIAAGSRAELKATLDSLHERGFVEPDETELAGAPALRFRHALIRQAAYERTPKKRRAVLHERFAMWMESSIGERLAEFEEIIGYHQEQAYTYRVELRPAGEGEIRLAARAAEHLAACGDRANARGDVSATLGLMRRADRLLGPEDGRRARVLVGLGGALREQGNLGEAKGALKAAIDLALATGDRPLWWRATFEIRDVEMDEAAPGFADRAVEEAEQMVAELERVGDHEGLAMAWRLMAGGHWSAGRLGRAEEATRRGVEEARLAGDRRQEVEMAAGLAGLAFLGPAPAVEAVERGRDIMRNVEGNRRAEGYTGIYLAGGIAMLGMFDEARGTLASAIATLREVGIKRWAYREAAIGAFIEHLAGDPRAAEGVVRRYLDGPDADEFVTPEFVATFFRAGSIEEALGYADRCEKAGDPADRWLWLGAEAAALAAARRKDEALERAREAETLCGQHDSPMEHAETLVFASFVYGEARLENDRRRCLSAAEDLFARKGSLMSAERARGQMEMIPP